MIDTWDRWAIRAWHEGWHPAALDAIAPLWREKSTWLPFYVALLAWLLWRDRLRGLALALAVGVAAGLADFISAGVLKGAFGRLRPCNTEGLREHLDLLTGCGPGLSFPSAHATNHFALAIALGLLVFTPRRVGRKGARVWWWVLLAWAASIALAQVYVGRHYPTDVLAGAVLGSIIGWGVASAFTRADSRFRKTAPAPDA